MARRRRPPRHKIDKPRRPSQGDRARSMSSDDLQGSQSGTQSSIGTLSDHDASEGAQTAMTSMHTTDEEMADDAPEHGGHAHAHHDADLQSIYPASQYPQVASSHRTEMPYLTAGSFVANSDIAASTQSLWAQDLDYREIHDRLYCREWFMPIDEIEQLRASLNHQIFRHVLQGEHSTVELDDPANILDIGTGTGEWATKMAETYPRCEVVGTDIAAVAETKSVPMNVFFEIEDAEDWDRQPDFYDLIHLRCMDGAFRDWSFIYDSVFYSLKPGGWVEVQDFDSSAEGIRRFLEHFSAGSPIHQLFADLEAACARSGRPRGAAHMSPHALLDAGFVDVRTTEYQIPLTVAERSAGRIWLISCLDSLEALCLRPLTEHMGWDPDKCKAACETAARELAELAKDPDTAGDMVVKMCVVAGRKPIDAPPAGSPPHPPDSCTDLATSTPGTPAEPVSWESSPSASSASLAAAADAQLREAPS